MIRTLVSQYDTLERMCDELLEQEDNLVREVYRHTSQPKEQAGVEQDTPVPGKGTESFMPQNKLSLHHIDFEDFKALVTLAKKTVPMNFVNSAKHFILNARRFQTDEIDACEHRIQFLLSQMKEIEQNILNRVPTHPKEGVAKLRFIVGLLLDGSEIDTDYFAYQVDECACAFESFVEAIGVA